nr:PREDICTED: unconventional myosin-XV [Phalacrocorax carbo]
MPEDPPVADKKGYKELLDEGNEASNKTQREQVTTDGGNESEDEGTDSAGLEAEEKMKKQDDMARKPKSILAESSEEDDDQQAQGCDPAAWLNSELLLPQPTVENLSKWAVYKDPHLANSHVMKVCKEPWEAEDITDNMLEMEFMQKQVYMCEDHCVGIEETEDLTRLEYVSSVTYIGQILVSVNPFKDLRIYSEDVATQYHRGTLSKNAPHIFAIAEMAYTLSQSSEQEQCVVISGHSGSGKTEAAKAIVQYLTTLYQRSDSHRIRQPCSVLPILESFGNARTILNDNSSRFGKLLNVHLQHGVVVGTSISQYLLEKSRVVFQARGERNYHVFYELLAGLPVEQKEELYLQEAESYYYLNQGRACDILGKEDGQDFLVLVQALEGISLSDDQLTSTWAVLAAILQLGNICFTSYEKESYEHAAIASNTEIQIVANLLRVSADFLQSAVTHRVTVTSYDRIFTPLSVEGAIDARDSIAKTLYYLLFEWLLLRINEWLAPWESDCAVGIVDIHGFEDLGVNSLEQLCINFANEHLQSFFSQTVIAQEEATDHTFLQKCHYHHGNSPWYAKPKLPLPVFTVKHYAGPVTYQVHKFVNKNRDQLRPEVLDIFSQSHLKVVSHIFQKAKAAYSQQKELGTRGKGPKPQASTLVSKFQQSLQDLTAKLRRSHAFFIRCITPNPKKDVGLLEIPAELAVLLQLAEGQYQAQAKQITEGLPPEVKVKDDLSLPPTINSYPFSSFIKSHFENTYFPVPGQPLQHPLTHLDAEHHESALEINKLVRDIFLDQVLVEGQILRFIGDKSLHGWQEVLLGNYIAGRGLNNVALRNEIFSQVVAQTWKNPDTEHSQRAWVLMATLLSCFAPSPALEKPLLKFVSDHGMEGYNAVCQRKILTAAQHTEIDATFARAYPPTQLEWTANQRRGKMVLDVHTFNEEKFSAEVESWMTGEQYAGWLLNARGCDKKSRGWSLSMFTGNTWQDLLGCDFVLDLIGEMEETSNLSNTPQSSAEYPITSERERSFLRNSDLDLIPPAPGIQAPTFPPPSMPPEFSNVHPDSRFRGDLRTPVGLDHYVDDLFSTVLHQGSRVPDMENRESLTGRMKGGGKIGPTQRGIFPSTAMVMPQPVVPAIDPNQLAAQQQTFINQQAMLMAQQVTLQAISISQQQQQQQQQRWQQSLENSRPRVSSPPQDRASAPAPVPATSPKPKKPDSSQNAAPPPKAPEPPAKAEEPVYDYTEDQFSSSEDDDYPRETFQQKREYFQKMAPASPSPPPELKSRKQTKKAKEPPVVKPSGPESRPEPSREIRNIIKMYQSRPAPEPQPIEPTRRVPKPFMKKNDPKNEALAKLGMMNLPSPKSPTPLPQEKKTPPPLKPKPGSASNSIKEEQLPLLSTFSQENSTVTIADDDGIKTQLYKLTASVSFSYVNPPWKIFLRKEVFYPKENFSHPYYLNLLCEQILRDTFSDSCLRISREEKRKMKDLLMEFRVGNDVQSIQEDGIKKRIVLAARDNWANYFSRLFPVHGENGSDVQILGVSHRGMRLLKVVKASGYNPEHLKILHSYSFADVLSVELKGSNALEFSLKTEQLFLCSPKAPCIKAMVELFIQELRQDTNYVVALRSYITDDKSLLSFKKGDLIKLLPMQGVEPGWQFGSTGGRSGIFPTSLVQLAAAPDYLSTSMDRCEGLRKSMKGSLESRNTVRESSVPSLTSEPNSNMLVPAGDHYTMMDFATAYFREAQSTQRLKGVSAEKKSVADLVQHTKVPIQESLLRYSDCELNELATKNFKTLMRLMGDQSKLKNQNEVECIYEILQLCKEKESLHDEVYCQVIKQVTRNPNQESVLRGWLLLSLLTGYFLPSNILMPYATKFLQLASSDPSSTHHDIAKNCQSNMRKNFLYGGRRHLPSPVETEALLVAKELLQEICEQMGVGDQEETQEFVFFAIRNNTVRPIRSEEYIHDYLLEDKLVTVPLRRLTWMTPLHFENKIYTDFHYGQVLWDYLNGRILLSRSKEMEMEVGVLATLQHWAKTKQQNSAPSREELKEYTPKTLQSSISPQALQDRVGILMRTKQPLQALDAKIQLIEHVMKLPFFGYNTYFVERVSDDTIPVPCFFGVNKEKIIVVDSINQVVSHIIPLKELQKMRTLQPVSDGGLPGIELNYGSAASPKTMWLELSQAKEMYHTIVVILDKTDSHH